MMRASGSLPGRPIEKSVQEAAPVPWPKSVNERSSCSADQDLTAEELEDMPPDDNPAPYKKAKAPKQENMEALEGLDTLPNLAILGEGEVLPSSSSSQATTKHPRHQPGCSCILCIQPPSGKGPKHKQTCTCNVCQTVKRRFRTLRLRRERKQLEKEAEGSRKKPQHQNLSLAEKSPEDNPSQCNDNVANNSPSQKKVGNDGSDNEMNRVKSSGSPFKGQIEVLPSSSSSSQATTKHPRHRPGCLCILCIQPPSGKGPKHKQTCTCNVCQTVKRRFRTLMLRRERKQSEKEAEGSRKKPQHQNLSLAEKLPEDDPSQCNNNVANSSPSQKKVGNDGSDNEMNRVKSSGSPFKGQIDLNIQPEREEERLPGSDSGGMMKLLHDATQKYLRQRVMPPDSFRNSTGDPAELDLDGGERLVSDTVESGQQEVNEERAKALASTVHK